jgi:hypothetical protein
VFIILKDFPCGLDILKSKVPGKKDERKMEYC